MISVQISEIYRIWNRLFKKGQRILNFVNDATDVFQPKYPKFELWIIVNWQELNQRLTMIV